MQALNAAFKLPEARAQTTMLRGSAATRKAAEMLKFAMKEGGKKGKRNAREGKRRERNEGKGVKEGKERREEKKQVENWERR